MIFAYKITVFTPTYNRAYVIKKLYESLRCQSFRNFELLVVDDGSTDNTDELFNGWISEEKDFKIRYFKKKKEGNAEQ